MPFDVTCPSCGETIGVADEHQGWTVRCPYCRETFQANPSAMPEEHPRLEAEPPAEPASPEIPRVRPMWEADDLARRGDHRRVDRAAARGAVATPAAIMGAVAWLHLILAAFFLVGFFLAAQDANQNGDEESFNAALMGGIVAFIMVVYFSLIVYGCRQMKTLSSYYWAVAACVMSCLGLLLCGCGWFMLMAAIWGLVIINRPDIRDAFDDQQPHDRPLLTMLEDDRDDRL